MNLNFWNAYITKFNTAEEYRICKILFGQGSNGFKVKEDRFRADIKNKGFLH